MPNMVEASDQKLQSFKDDWKIVAEKLVLETFPDRVLQLNNLINTKQFSLERINEVHQDLNIPVPEAVHLLGTTGGDFSASKNGPVLPKKRHIDESVNGVEGTPVMAFTFGPVASNKFISELCEVVKPYVRQAVEDVNKVKVWILFLIPRIEDGNNFGVSIQEETLGEVRAVESEAASLLDQISRYYLLRGKIISKLAKYPHIEDYRRSIADLDEKQFLSLRLVLMEVRNHYSTLHDMITKNFEKIKRPRTSNADHLY